MGDMSINKVDIISILNLDTIKEHASLEFKEAGNSLPNSLWSSYSSFANTKGGMIVLGIKEENGKFYVSGVVNPHLMVKMFWDVISSKTKVNRNILMDDDVQIVYDISGKAVIAINVPEAPHNLKPIYINSNPTYSYLRRGESDQKATEDELNAMIRNSSIGTDSIRISSFTIDDLDAVTVSDFKSRVSIRFKEKGYESLSNEDFLKEIGFFTLERRNNIYLPTHGCLLMLGKYNSIKEVFPSYYLDFVDYRDTEERWRDRVSTDLPHIKEMNLFNFFNIVYDKLIAADETRFVLDEKKERRDISLITALREALINTIVHADYNQVKDSIKIEIHDEWYKFSNPGTMLIGKDLFFKGGVSQVRNEILMKGFRLLGFAERQGMGGREIAVTT